nr:MAG TPA: Protein of unknown function (DUF3624) [Caudoviricetes sp.]
MLKRCTYCSRFSDVKYLDKLGRCRACQLKAEEEKEVIK